MLVLCSVEYRQHRLDTAWCLVELMRISDACTCMGMHLVDSSSRSLPRGLSH